MRLPPRPLVLTVLTVLVLTAAAAATARPAAAAPGIRYGIKDDAWLLHGPGTLEGRVATLQSLGVQIVRFGLRWDQIAPAKPQAPTDPNDPAYRWDGWDSVLQALHQAGIETMLGIWGTPPWANGGRGPSSAPTSGTAVAGFAAAAAARYPWIHRWLIWNEPNQRRWLQPTSAAVYVSRILNPAYAALHRAIAGVQVGGGVTAPRGGVGGVSPVTWIDQMRRAHARLDAFAENPYPLDPHNETPTTGGCGHCLTYSMATLPRLLAAVRAAFGGTRVWLTEYGYQTSPPDPVLGVSPALQARYESEAALRAYLAPRVDVLIHFLYQDEPDLGGWQSGLVFANRRPKPALRAFQLPLAVRWRHGSTVSLWGEVRASSLGAYRLEVYRGGWRPLTSPAGATGRGFFTWTGPLPRGAKVRVVAGSVAGPALSVA
ncbi:MAG TPA: hypothetical protein VIU44_12105 [Gaiellaceae bacterium]